MLIATVVPFVSVPAAAPGAMPELAWLERDPHLDAGGMNVADGT
jgi:hypothetical protein